MEKQEELLKKRFIELANRSYNENRFTFTNFLSEQELSLFYETEREIGNIPYTVFGGAEDTERVMIRFGSEEELGYAEDFPISIIEISPLLNKFADNLTHRDFLGALMNLGIERETLGDIIINEKTAYVFALSSMKDFIFENLSTVKHTSIKLKVVDRLPETEAKEKELKLLQVSSLRLDAVIAKTLNISREASIDLFREKKVFLNGRLIENNSKLVKAGDKVTARGFGRFLIADTPGLTKKGKENVLIQY